VTFKGHHHFFNGTIIFQISTIVARKMNSTTYNKKSFKII